MLCSEAIVTSLLFRNFPVGTGENRDKHVSIVGVPYDMLMKTVE